VKRGVGAGDIVLHAGVLLRASVLSQRRVSLRHVQQHFPVEGRRINALFAERTVALFP
jgi:hypothetical protein